MASSGIYRLRMIDRMRWPWIEKRLEKKVGW